jgi:hypothetical protein
MRIKLMTGGAALAGGLLLIPLMHESAQSAGMTGLSLTSPTPLSLVHGGTRT